MEEISRYLRVPSSMKSDFSIQLVPCRIILAPPSATLSGDFLMGIESRLHRHVGGRDVYQGRRKWLDLDSPLLTLSTSVDMDFQRLSMVSTVELPR